MFIHRGNLLIECLLRESQLQKVMAPLILSTRYCASFGPISFRISASEMKRFMRQYSDTHAGNQE